MTDTVRTTLRLFRDGHDAAAIATLHDLALSTVEGHLATALEAGERLEIERLVSEEKARAIRAAFLERGCRAAYSARRSAARRGGGYAPPRGA